MIGPVSARLRVRASGPHFDVFARLCDVDQRGRSRNVCDGLIRHGPGGCPGRGADSLITVPMSATAYRFRAGHRLRLQVSGGAHPRFARNTGTGEPRATATRLAAVDLAIVHDAADPGGLSLPVPAGLGSVAARGSWLTCAGSVCRRPPVWVGDRRHVCGLV